MALRTILTIAWLLSTGGDPLFNLLPADGCPPGWQRHGQERLFTGAALYQHINGGAELYHQFGFDRLVVQDYAGDAHEARVEIYKMNDPAGAAAVFVEITKGMTRQAVYGTTCVLDDYQILFLRQAYCVSVSTYESQPETLAALAALATKIDTALIDLGR
ncbi:MAG: hypothetical protein JXI33_05645 [Candidatus Aminicenantes bacterium]|nr:hypothetical protein [Candidatus Aminicenantes bacterium]